MRRKIVRHGSDDLFQFRSCQRCFPGGPINLTQKHPCADEAGILLEPFLQGHNGRAELAGIKQFSRLDHEYR